MTRRPLHEWIRTISACHAYELDRMPVLTQCASALRSARAVLDGAASPQVRRRHDQGRHGYLLHAHVRRVRLRQPRRASDALLQRRGPRPSLIRTPTRAAALSRVYPVCPHEGMRFGARILAHAWTGEGAVPNNSSARAAKTAHPTRAPTPPSGPCPTFAARERFSPS